jgi:small subunit ribosomal protein S21
VVTVSVRDNNVDQALRVLKKKMQREGIFREMKMRRDFEKPSIKKKREQAESIPVCFNQEFKSHPIFQVAFLITKKLKKIISAYLGFYCRHQRRNRVEQKQYLVLILLLLLPE